MSKKIDNPYWADTFMVTFFPILYPNSNGFFHQTQANFEAKLAKFCFNSLSAKLCLSVKSLMEYFEFFLEI